MYLRSRGVVAFVVAGVFVVACEEAGGWTGLVPGVAMEGAGGAFLRGWVPLEGDRPDLPVDCLGGR